MNRRDFLTSILGGVAAAAILPQIETIHAAIATDAVRWNAAYRAIHEEAWRLFQVEMARRGLPIQPKAIEYAVRTIGHETPRGGFYTNQIQVSTNTFHVERSIEPAMAALAEHAAAKKLDQWGGLPLPQAVLYAGVIGALRMTVMFGVDEPEDDPLVRFDVLGARLIGA